MSAILDGKTGHEREVLLAAFSDDELVDRIYDLVIEVDIEARDDMYALLTEAFERFAPMSEWRNNVDSLADDPARAFELESTREAMARRARARIMGRFTVGEEADDAA